MPTQDVLDGLFQNGALVDLSIGFWSARRSNDAEDLGLDRDEIPEYVVGLGTKMLIPKSYTDDWSRSRARAYHIVRKWSQPFPVGDSYFVPNGALPRVESELVEEQKVFNASRDRFGKNFKTIKQDFLTSLTKKERARIEPEIPARDVALSKFYFAWQLYTITLPKKLKTAMLDKAKRASQEKAQEKAQARYARELDTRVDQFLASSVKALRAKTEALCATVADRIKSGEVVTNRSLDTLRTHVERFKMLNFVGDVEIEKRLTALQKDILDGADAGVFLDSETMRASLEKACNGIAAAAHAVSDVSSVTGGFKRRIVI